MTLRQHRDSLTSVPFNTLLGMRLHRVHRDGITIDCTLRNDLRNGVGAAHGGIAAAMADAAVGGAIQRHFGGEASDHHRGVKDQRLSTSDRRPHLCPVAPSSHRLHAVCG
jgi:acyl-coenzyme A thioesterase PaaI-like protein